MGPFEYGFFIESCSLSGMRGRICPPVDKEISYATKAVRELLLESGLSPDAAADLLLRIADRIHALEPQLAADLNVTRGIAGLPGAPQALNARSTADPHPAVQPAPHHPVSPLMTTASFDGHLVFVYGSLKARHANHGYLGGGAFLGRRLLIGAHLHNLGAYPMAVLNQDSEAVLHGELYRVDTAGLAQLDRLEGYPGYYNRSRCRLSDGTVAWVFHGQSDQVSQAPRLSNGDWATTPVLHYGSNLDPSRLARRCPDWDGHGLVVELDGWSWAIDKQAHGSTIHGYAGIRLRPDSSTWGVVTHLSGSDIEELDVCEGVSGGHYVKTTVTVKSRCGAAFEVLTYVPGDSFRRSGLVAAAAYRNHILTGLDHWELPAAWRSTLDASLSTTA
ncbi:gamma-glutamylcyclotransferase [Synechococcus sp. BO 8801]|uniref:gamma-glutamylcyclotransferase n=1 Tax=Synechococcus sp. BO 8801 TaxID=169670 RepID=UPI00117DE09F|nr:gamma-glutamylcyclotransferase [Synechococcus sp. BO 8801]